MIEVVFGTNLSDKRTAAKTVETIDTKSCELKGDCSVTDPVLIVTGDAAEYAACNYFTIAAFNRAYFVTGGPTALPGGLLEIRGHCDVLSSAWMQGLDDLDAVIDRQQNVWNLYLNDGTFQGYANDKVITKDFSGGFTSPSFVLVVAG